MIIGKDAIDPTDSGLFDVAVMLVFAGEKLGDLAEQIEETEIGRAAQIREAREAMRGVEEYLRELSCTDFCDILTARTYQEAKATEKPNYCRTLGRS